MKNTRFIVTLALLVLSGSAEAASYPPISLGDDSLYSVGPYGAFIAPYNKGSFVFGKDYTEAITLMSAALPNSVGFSWKWPEISCTKGVYVFSYVEYGDYDYTVKQPFITPKQINNIAMLFESHAASFSGELQNYNVIDDLFLTRNAADNSTNTAEVEVFLHTSAAAAYWVQYQLPRIGTFVDPGGISWIVGGEASSSGGTADYVFMPANEKDIPVGTSYLKLMLQYLVGQNKISGSLYFNGVAFGVEVKQGSGSMNLSSFAVTFD